MGVEKRIQMEQDRKPWDNISAVIDLVNHASYPLEDSADLDPLIEEIGDARCVLLGEASHGTSEYYLWRARISQRLIAEKGFSFIAVEGDWPDCYQINRYIKGYSGAGQSVEQVLSVFNRWPTWMWANWEVSALVNWLRHYNQNHPTKVGFYGLDVYSLWESMESIVRYLDKTDPETAKIARQAYLCFEPYGEDVQAYAWSTRMVPDTCENEVVDLLREMRQKVQQYDSDPEASFNAEQNALVMVNAERYYRAMVRSDQNSWNVRDRHMAETLDRLLKHHGDKPKAIVWAHNTHVGDARYTDMAQAGMVNIGQLVREQHADQGVVLVGFSSHRGSVIAGREWEALMERMEVPAAREGSWDDVFHQAGSANKLLLMDRAKQETVLASTRGQRAIGVVYNPEVERYDNYVPTQLSNRYDAFLFIDETTALHPLQVEPQKTGEPPELYPWGF